MKFDPKWTHAQDQEIQVNTDLTAKSGEKPAAKAYQSFKLETQLKSNHHRNKGIAKEIRCDSGRGVFRTKSDNSGSFNKEKRQ